MKIALLGSYPIYPFKDQVHFWNSRPDLTTTWNYNLARGLSRLPGCEVHVVTSAPLLHTRVLQTDSLTIHFVGHLPKLNLWDYLTRMEYSRFNLHRILNQIRPDVVHGSGTDHEYAYAAVTSRFPNLFTVHGVMKQVVAKMHSPWHSVYRVLADVERKVVARGTCMIAISQYVAQQFSQFTGKTFLIPNCVDDIFFSTNEPERYDIAWVGKFVPLKGVFELVQAVRSLKKDFPDLHVKLIGGGGDENYRATIQRYVSEHGLQPNVEFVGQVQPAELPALLGQARVVAIPSHEESFSMVCAESQALGKPVVASRVGALPELVRDGETGLLVGVGDVDEFARSLGVLLADPKRRTTMGTQARTFAKQRFTMAAVAARTVEAYEHVLRNTVA